MHGPNDIAAALTEFSGAVRTRLDRLDKGHDEVNARIAAMRVGAGETSHSDNDLDRARAFAAFGTYCRTGQGHSELMPSGGGISVIRAEGSTDRDSQGGFTVPTRIDLEIARVMADSNPMRTLAKVVTIQNGRYSKLISTRGTTTAWRGERGTVVETAEQAFSQITPMEGELVAYPKVSQWLLSDSQYDIAGELATEIAEEFSEAEEAAFINGDGINKPLGFMGATKIANASAAFGKIGFVKSGNASSFAATAPADALLDLVFALRAPYRNGAAWLMNSNTAASVMKLKDGQSNYLWTPSLITGAPSNLAGYPVYVSEQMPDIAANAYPIAFGNFERGYLILDRIGTTILRDPYTSPGWVKFLVQKRVGGAMLDSTAIKLLKISA